MTRPIEPLDPQERKFYRYDFVRYLAALGASVGINPATVQIELDSASQVLGVQLGTGSYAPQISGTLIAVAFQVAVPNQSAPEFTGGHRATVTVRFDTTAPTPESLVFRFPLLVKRAA